MYMSHGGGRRRRGATAACSDARRDGAREKGAPSCSAGLRAPRAPTLARPAPRSS